MRYRVQLLLILVVAAVMLAGCAAGESNMSFMEGLAYDETDHTWTTNDENKKKLVRIMRQECAFPDTATGVRLRHRWLGRTGGREVRIPVTTWRGKCPSFFL